MKSKPFLLPGLLPLFFFAGPAPAEAAEHAAGAYHLAGAGLPGWWALPFGGMLLSIALGPLLAPHFWEHHFGKAAALWSVLFIVPCWLVHGAEVAAYVVLETMILEYMPFVILLLSLFTIAGGIRLAGSLVGRPGLNTALLLTGAALASLMGTTGAAMLLIRPLLRANAYRRYRVHTVIFFIFLVANIGGSLTPLGDPPLFLGFLKGVSFFWPAANLFGQTLSMVAALLLIYYLTDTALYKKEGRPRPAADGPPEPIRVEGAINFLFLAGVVGMVLLSGLWANETRFHIWADIYVTLPNLMRDLILLVFAGLSLALTKPEIRRGNSFTWGPIAEVAKLFAGIFITMVPAIAILKAGPDGALAGLVALASTAEGLPLNHMYFWLTGGLSSFLDNAPTYLVFFNMAGGEAGYLMSELSGTLAAISTGAVFMGANTYIGNAPNFMVRAIAEENGLKMPSFFGYMAWSVGILIPLFILLTFVFFI
ncbi:MAG: sodium:proton antiporter [Candidatus Adiutrix sp.]|jgi:Na+/H+ antiporter NhaD/arsenite permease-like protein|nr:sodium:proton antiporter [Candidatus Adiutrix sp.]